MSSLQDTPQQALAGWLHQRGGERAAKKMTHDLGVAAFFVGKVMDTRSKYGDFMSPTFAASLALYTDGEVIFPSCPDWAVEKVREIKSDALMRSKLLVTNAELLRMLEERQRFERSWLFKLWRFFHG